jgi:predicted nucleotidyltransferase
VKNHRSRSKQGALVLMFKARDLFAQVSRPEGQGEMMSRTSTSSGYPVPVTEELLRQITQRIVEEFTPEKVILFGSHAWGKPHRDSDVDLLVMMETSQPTIQVAAAIARAARPRFLALDVLVKTPQEVAERARAKDFFIQKILREGQVLYER